MRRSFGRLISIIYRKNQAYLNYALEDLGISSSELPVLLYLNENHGVSQEELSSFLLIDKAATTRIVQSLLKKGLLQKEKNLTDKRANRLFITDTAEAKIPEIKSRLDRMNQYLTTDLDSASTEVALDVLDQIVKKIEKDSYRGAWRKEE